jgi:hypothetical protein
VAPAEVPALSPPLRFLPPLVCRQQRLDHNNTNKRVKMVVCMHAMCCDRSIINHPRPPPFVVHHTHTHTHTHTHH